MIYENYVILLAYSEIFRCNKNIERWYFRKNRSFACATPITPFDSG